MKKHYAPILAALLLLLPTLYVTSYLALVVPEGYSNGRLNISTTIRLPNYRVGHRWAKVLYWSLEQLDRKLRPHKWEWWTNELRDVLDRPFLPPNQGDISWIRGCDCSPRHAAGRGAGGEGPTCKSSQFRF